MGGTRRRRVGLEGMGMRTRRLGRMCGRHRVAVIAALSVLAICGSVAVYSGASFNYRTANPVNVFTAGNLSHSNSKNGSAILTIQKMKPGDSTTGDVVITNSGDINGAFRLARSALTDAPGANGGVLSSVLNLTIVDLAAPGTPVYSGKLGAFTAPVALGTWIPGTAKTYRFTVGFPDGGAPGGNTTGDNAYKGSSTTATFDWTSVQ
jgi:hypothetical protein